MENLKLVKCPVSVIILLKCPCFIILISQGFNSIPLNYLKNFDLFDILYSNHCILLFSLFMYVVLEDGRL